VKAENLIQQLETELSKIGVRMRREKGNFRGGWCTVNDEEFLVLNKRQSAETQFAILAEALRDYPLDSVYLKPNLRSALEEQWARQTPTVTSDTDESND
jgi:hypothetical protein